jgi:hypothetical protein
MWFQTDSTTTKQTLWSDTIKAFDTGLQFYIDTDSKLKVATVLNSVLIPTGGLATTASVTTGWHHGVAIFGSSSNRQVYLDGVGPTPNLTTLSIGTRTAMSVGARWANSVIGAYFNGRLAEVTIWRASLNDGERKALAAGAPSLSIRPGDIIAYYPLGGFRNESSRDFSSGGRDLTQVGSPTWADHPAVWFPQPIYFAPSGAQSVTLDVISATTAVNGPTITPGPVGIVAPLIAATTTVQEPSIAVGAVNIAAPLIAATTTVQQPSLSVGPVDVSLPVVAATTTVYEPTINLGITIAVDNIPATTTVYQPNIAVGAVNIATPLIAATTSVYEPAITLGALNVTLPLIAATTSVYQPQVELMLQIIGLDRSGPNSVVRQPEIVGTSTDTRDVLETKKPRKRKQSIKEQLEEENVAAQILRARQEQARLDAEAAQSVEEEEPVTAPAPLITEAQKTDVQQAMAAYQALQVRNKRLKTLLLMAAMED